jgi:hypothetical protein
MEHRDSSVLKPTDESLQEKVPCPVCYSKYYDIPLDTLVPGAVEQWLACHRHESEGHGHEQDQERHESERHERKEAAED